MPNIKACGMFVHTIPHNILTSYDRYTCRAGVTGLCERLMEVHCTCIPANTLSRPTIAGDVWLPIQYDGHLHLSGVMASISQPSVFPMIPRCCSFRCRLQIVSPRGNHPLLHQFPNSCRRDLCKPSRMPSTVIDESESDAVLLALKSHGILWVVVLGPHVWITAGWLLC